MSTQRTRQSQNVPKSSSPSSTSPNETAIETNSIDSRDSRSRPLKIGDRYCDVILFYKLQINQFVFFCFYSQFDSNCNPIEGQSENHSVGIQKSDSLDSSRAVCCTKLAFNIYNKALESAKKALPL